MGGKKRGVEKREKKEGGGGKTGEEKGFLVFLNTYPGMVEHYQEGGKKGERKGS